MRSHGDPRRQARLADTRLAGHNDQAAAVARGLLQKRTHALQRCRAADKRSPLDPRQHRGQLHVKPPRTRGTCNRLSAAKNYAAERVTQLRLGLSRSIALDLAKAIPLVELALPDATTHRHSKSSPPSRPSTRCPTQSL